MIRTFKKTPIEDFPLNFPICLSGEFCIVRSENDRNKLNLWNITNCELIRTFEASKDEASEDRTIHDMLMHKDRLITKSRNGIIKIWDIHTGKVVTENIQGDVEGFIDENIMVIRTPSSTPLFTEANTLSFWDIRSGTCLVACPMLQGVPRLELNPKLMKGKVFIHFTKELTDKELKDFNEKNGTVLRSQRVRGLIEERRHQIILRDYSRLHEKAQPSRCIIC